MGGGRIHHTPRSLGRTLPVPALRTGTFGILSRCQLPRPNCQRTKQAATRRRLDAGVVTARELVMDRGSNRNAIAPDRASTHDHPDSIGSPDGVPTQSRAAHEQLQDTAEFDSTVPALRNPSGTVRERQEPEKNRAEIPISPERRDPICGNDRADRPARLAVRGPSDVARGLVKRLRSESNRRWRICNPLP